jgi:hypothetical protein
MKTVLEDYIMVNILSNNTTPAAALTYTGSAAPAKSAETSEKPLVSSDSFTKSYSSNGVSSYQFKNTMKKVAMATLGVLGAAGGAIGGAMAGAAGGAVGGVVLGIAGAATGAVLGGMIAGHNKPGFDGLAASMGGALLGAIGGGIGGVIAGVGAGSAAGAIGGVCGAVAGGMGGLALSQLKVSFG